MPSNSSAERTKIAAEISRLLAHYWSAAEDQRLRAAVSRDWLEDLQEFRADWVEEACRQWRRSEPKRPTISDIRKLCQRIRDDERANRTGARYLLTDAQRAEVQARERQIAAEQDERYRLAFEWRQQFAEERGFANFAEVIRYGIVRAMKMPTLAERATSEPSKPAPEITDG